MESSLDLSSLAYLLCHQHPTAHMCHDPEPTMPCHQHHKTMLPHVYLLVVAIWVAREISVLPSALSPGGTEPKRRTSEKELRQNQTQSPPQTEDIAAWEKGKENRMMRSLGHRATCVSASGEKELKRTETRGAISPRRH